MLNALYMKPRLKGCPESIWDFSPTKQKLLSGKSRFLPGRTQSWMDSGPWGQGLDTPGLYAADATPL